MNAMCGSLTYQGNNHQEAIKQLFEINNNIEDFHCNIVTQTLHEKVRVEFINRGSRNLLDKDNVLDLLE